MNGCLSFICTILANIHALLKMNLASSLLFLFFNYLLVSFYFDVRKKNVAIKNIAILLGNPFFNLRWWLVTLVKSLSNNVVQ